MKHHNANRKFGREANGRRALLRSLAYALVRDGKITTTEARAKELRPFIEKLVTKAAEGTLASRRLVTSRIASDDMAKKLVDEIAGNYKERAGGYTRIVKLPARAGDASPMATIEFV